MDLIKKLKKDYMEAFKQKNIIKKDILNYTIAKIKDKQISKGDNLSEDEVIKVIRKEIKSRKESIKYLKKANKKDEIEKEKKKISILEEYLPKLFDKSKLTKIVKEFVQENDIEDPASSRWEIIKPLMSKYPSKIDGKLLNQIINEL